MVFVMCHDTGMDNDKTEVGDMAVFFKATRPDGTDFRTGTVDYASLCGTGNELPRLSSVTHPRCCSGDVYHASTVAAETLVGGSWPCRLFEVEGTPVAYEAYKRGFYTLRVVRELPAWQALGPNGQAVAALLDRAKRLTDVETVALGNAWVEVMSLSYEWTRDEAYVSARSGARTAAWEAVHDAVWNIPFKGEPGLLKNHARRAVKDTTTALIVRDLISPQDFDTLYGPWHSVIGDQ